MTTAEIIACAISITAAIVAITAYVLTVRRSRRDSVVRYQMQYPFRGGLITTGLLTEAEFDALREKLEAEYAQYRDGRAMPVTLPEGEEEPSACPAYQRPATPADSGLCARCGMYDYKHQEATGA